MHLKQNGQLNHEVPNEPITNMKTTKTIVSLIMSNPNAFILCWKNEVQNQTRLSTFS